MLPSVAHRFQRTVISHQDEMKLFGRNKMKELKKKEAELLSQMRGSNLTNEELLGKYKLPPTFRKLQEIQNTGQISIQSIGFELWLDRPIHRHR